MKELALRTCSWLKKNKLKTTTLCIVLVVLIFLDIINDMEMPNVRIGDQIRIGNHFGAPKADVVRVYTDEEKKSFHSGDVEVIYLQNVSRKIKEDAVWNGEEWEFKNEGPSGFYVR